MIESSIGGKDFFSQGRPKNDFIYILSRIKFKEERIVLSFPKDDSTLDCGDRCLVLSKVWTSLRMDHLIMKDVWTTEGTHQHLDEQENGGQTERHDREPTRNVRKNHPTSDSIRYPEGSVRAQGVHRVNYREMIALSLTCYTLTIMLKNYEEALNDEFWINAGGTIIGRM